MVSQVAGAAVPGMLTCILVLAIMMGVAVLAFLSPAIRAMRTDPSQVLRDD
jgi:ABC-type lipoprotein release transport system permease subunit